MSNGDDEDASGDEAASEETAVETAVTVDSLDDRLTDASEAIEAAETEADLDDVEADLDAIATDLEETEFDVDEDDEEDPVGDLEDRLSDLQDRLADQRGPYGEDVVDAIEDAQGTVTDTRWTDDGQADVVDAVETFLGAAADELDDAFTATGEDPEALAEALADVADAVESAGLDADEDGETIAALLSATDALADDLEAAEEWDDLSVREQLDAQGFYDVLESENRKDFPPEWNAVKVHEKLGNVEPILLALDTFDSDFMEENILDTLWRMAPEEAFEEMHARAQKRNKKPVEILGKIGDDRACETLHEFIDGDGDAALQKVTLRALGEIGSEESTQPVANRLAADNYEIRSAAARALGLIGDTRAIDPLADVLADDEADEVRASAAWALNQIGTERALEELSAYADDQSYIVQAEAEKAV
jgi:HEAT repeat protein